MHLRTLREAQIKKGTRVLMRAGFDVPLKEKKILDTSRIDENIPTLRFVLKKGGYLRIMTKIGRPQGHCVSSLSVKPVARYLERLLRRKVIMVSDPLDKKNLEKYGQSRDVIIFENIYFWPGERKGDHKFAYELARWGDMYVNEAFASSHRKDASIVRIPKILPHFAGLRLEKEVVNLERILQRPKHPLVAVIGGIKLDTKLPLVKRFLKEADRVLIGSGFADLLSARRAKNLHVPLDYVVSRGEKVDIGPKTIAYFENLIKDAKTIVWNGPLGFTPYFPEGTKKFANILAKSRAFRVIGGGDTVAVLQELGVSLGSFDHVSTGGGAMLEFLAGKKLPGIEALKK